MTEPFCHNPRCPKHGEPLPEIAAQDVHYFLGPDKPIRFCAVCTAAVKLVSKNPYGIRPEFFI